jgi:anaerobic magnesium-protoporphyrin IX monomethyl ester cyclase
MVSNFYGIRVLVLNPASEITGNVVRDVLYGCWCGGKRIGGGTVMPFEQLLVATVLQEAGHKVRFLDAASERMPSQKVARLAPDFDLVVISTSTMTINEDAAILAQLKKANPNILTAAYGSHPTFMPESSLARSSIDISVQREPTMILAEVAGKLAQKQDWSQVAGIAYREDGVVKINPEATFLNDLDKLPFLDLSLLPKDVDYFNPVIKRLPYVATSTSAGCPGRCTYCTAPFFHGRKLRMKSAKRVVEEVAHYASLGIKEIYFRDETFTASRKRVREICQGILARGLDVTWIANARVGTADRDLLKLMRRAGCHLIKVGVESGCQPVLDRVKKGIKLEDTRQLFADMKAVGMDSHAHMMLGLPGETVESLQSTIDFAISLEPTTVTFGICTPYPGTPLFEEVATIYPEINDGTGADFSKLHVQGFCNPHFTQLSSDYLRQAVPMAYRRFYMRPSYLLRSLTRIKDLNDVKRYALAGTKVFDFSIRGDSGAVN